MNTLIVRTARNGDYPELQRIYRRASLSNAGDPDALLAHPQFLVLDPQLIGRGRTRVATLSDGTVIAFASSSVTASRQLELDDLFTDPSWRRRGAARKLVAHIVAEAQAEGVARISVIANEHAMDFYRSVGFVADGPVRTALGGGVRMHLPVELPGAVRLR